MIDSTIYTNSLEAFHKSYERGYKYIEIDIQVINDTHIYGAHDMKRFKSLTNFSNKDTIDINYIKKSKIMRKYHIIYDKMIFKLLKKYKDLHIVTDKIVQPKLLKEYAKLINRLYVEVFTYKQYTEFKKQGFNHVMLNIIKENDLLNLLSSKNSSVTAITIGPEIFYSHEKELKILFKKRVGIYAYLIDNFTYINESYCKYVNGFYID